MKKIIRIIVIFVILIIVGGVLFIKINTQAAAEFTDNVLRPVLGSNNVIFMEKIFFNASDRLKQLTFKNGGVQIPKFSDDSNHSGEGSGLELNPISINKNFDQIKDEGMWKIMNLGAFPNEAVMAHTFVRPDKDRPYSVVTIAQLDMTKLNLGSVAGTIEPGSKVGKPGPGMVPKEIVKDDRLVAAFDGGFQFRDGEYGMIVDDKTYLPLKNDLGTVVGYKDGKFKIINYNGQDLGKDVSFIRQNCPILIENGEMSVEDIKNKKLWGRTLTSDIYTWRTGMGITKNGNILFAVGNNLTPSTLARSLKMAGAQDAIQLDINPNWVRFNIFNPIGNGKYNSKPLTDSLTDGSTSYLNGYQKDFFYLYKK